MEERVVELERRLARVERRERATRWGALVAVAAALALGAPRPAVTQGFANTVKAPFQVIDGTGKPLVAVTGGQSGGRLMLHDATGAAVASLYTDGDGGNLAIRNKLGHDVAMLAGPRGGILDVRDAAGKQVAVLFAGADGANLMIRNRSGRDVIQALANPTGDGKLGVYDASGKPVFEKP
jgi:hypothetical protein